jgi:hypothetical protein
LVDFTKEFLVDMGKLRDYLKSKREKHLEQTALERKSLMERRSVIKQDQLKLSDNNVPVIDKIKLILSRTFMDKFDEMCKDDDCKTKEVVEKVKRVLSNQEQMLLTTEEVAMFRKFASDNSDKVPKADFEVPKVILKIKKPEQELIEPRESTPKIILKVKKPEQKSERMESERESKPKIILKFKRPM